MKPLVLVVAHDDDLVPMLGQVILADEDPDLRLRAVQYLSREDGPAARALLEAATDDGDPLVRGMASDAMSKR